MCQSEHGHEGMCTGQPCKLISDSMSPSTTRRRDREKSFKLCCIVLVVVMAMAIVIVVVLYGVVCIVTSIQFYLYYLSIDFF